MILITGGSRSGKSRFALELGRAAAGRRVFIATCPALDDEMRERINRHKQERAQDQWDTVEAPVDAAGAFLKNRQAGVYVLDCLTLWINNLMYEAAKVSRQVSEDEIETRCAELLSAIREVKRTVIVVTNEVGLGIVPSDPDSRRFRDLVGRANQAFAAAADRVVLVTCGIPMYIKGAAGPGFSGLI